MILDSNIKIFPYSHIKDFVSRKIYESDSRYHILYNTDIQINYLDNSFEKSLNEGHGICYLWENEVYKKYEGVGIVHYRTSMDLTCLKDKDFEIAVLRPLFFQGSLYNQWDQPHEFLDVCLNLIYEYSREIYNSAISYINGNTLYARNHFIMKSTDFEGYCKFVFKILRNFCYRYNFYRYEDIVQYCEKNRNKYPLLNCNNFASKVHTVFYQCRTLGYLLERLTAIWINYRYDKKQITKCPMIVYQENFVRL